VTYFNPGAPGTGVNCEECGALEGMPCVGLPEGKFHNVRLLCEEHVKAWTNYMGALVKMRNERSTK